MAFCKWLIANCSGAGAHPTLGRCSKVMRRPSVDVQHYVACGVLATKELFHGRIYRKAHVPALSLRYRCADPGWRRERRVLGYGFRHLVWRLLRVHVLTLAAWP